MKYKKEFIEDVPQLSQENDKVLLDTYYKNWLEGQLEIERTKSEKLIESIKELRDIKSTYSVRYRRKGCANGRCRKPKVSYE